MGDDNMFGMGGNNSLFGVSTYQIDGLQLVKSPMMQEPILKKRTILERLFSLTPFKSHKVIGQKPLPYFIRVGNIVYGAPEMVEKVRRIDDGRK